MNDVVSMPIDPLYQKAMKFVENMKCKFQNHGISNIYVLQTIDQNGKVTDEKYGMNLMTDYGMSQYFVSRQAFPTNLYIGNGSGSFNQSTNALINAITTTASTSSNTTKAFNYPLYYDNVTGIITCISKYMEVYFDNNISGVSTDVDVSEYGIGTAYNALWTHSWVYNQLGERDVITKKVNERLYITVYFCMSYTESLINGAWSEGRCIAITTMERFYNRVYESSNYICMIESSINTFRRFDSITARSTTHTVSAFLENKITVSSNMGSVTITRDPNVNNEYIDGLVNKTSGFMMLERLKMGTPINFDVVVKPDPDHLPDVDGISYNFGKPNTESIFSQAAITGSYTYNYSDATYNAADHYVADPKWYSNTTFGSAMPLSIWYTNNNTIQQMYLFINTDLDDPIVAIGGNVVTVYATDKYWDTSSWSQISDLANVPQELRTKKYWLTTSGSVNLNPIRASRPLQYRDSNGLSFPTYGFSNMRQGIQHTVFNPTSGWFAVGPRAFFTSTYEDYVITTLANPQTTFNYYDLYSYEDMVIFLQDRYVDYAYLGATKSKGEYTVENNISFRDRHVSETRTGYVILHGSSSSSTQTKGELLILKNDTFAHVTISDSVDSACIMLTDYYAQIDVTEPRDVHVRDISGNIVRTFPIPSDKSAPKNVWGYKDFVYISDGSSYGYVGKISDGSLTETTGYFPAASYSNRSLMRVTAVDECAIVYSYDDSRLNKAYVVEASNPTVLKSLNGTNPRPNGQDPYHLELIKFNTDTIVLLLTEKMYGYGSSNTSAFDIVYDFGKMLKADAFSQNFTVCNVQENPTFVWVPYGEHMICGNKSIPIANLISHRLVGTTNSVTAYNHYKNISGKQWNLTVTNIGAYQGKPPGNVQ